MLRVGLGQDSHKIKIKNRELGIKNSRTLVLGGVLVDKNIEVSANSDGDVVLHSLFNSLSSAVGKESLGKYASPMCKKGITNSKEYVKVALNFVKKAGYKVNNVSIAIEAKRPKVSWAKQDAMKKVISKILKIKKENVGITFTSGEGLTSFGKGEGIQVFTLVSLAK
jgi:2-C-methyl-D-erythritol 2,4-cyclodiphosphate synthase